MLHFYTKEKVAEAKCRRCGKEAQGRCYMCNEVKYYEDCQRFQPGQTLIMFVHHGVQGWGW